MCNSGLENLRHRPCYRSALVLHPQLVPMILMSPQAVEVVEGEVVGVMVGLMAEVVWVEEVGVRHCRRKNHIFQK